MQNQLFRMSGSLAPTEMLCYRWPQMQDEGIMLDERASMMEGVCTVPMRATEGWAREVLNANDSARNPMKARAK